MENYFERLLENTWEELVIGVENQENEKGKLSPEKKKAAINLANYFSHTLKNINAEYDFKKILEEGFPYRAGG